MSAHNMRVVQSFRVLVMNTLYAAFCSDVTPSTHDVASAPDVSPCCDVTPAPNVTPATVVTPAPDIIPAPDVTPVVNPTHGTHTVDTMVPGYESDYQQSPSPPPYSPLTPVIKYAKTLLYTPNSLHISVRCGIIFVKIG